MAHRKLRLMISSRCKTKFPPDGDELSEIRKKLKKEIEEEEYFGKPLVDVWISEEETESGTSTSWEACMKEASNCDIFISLLDGDAGWQQDGSGIGICHAEFETAYTNSPGKVRVISLIDDNGKLKPKSGPDEEFLKAVENANLLEARNIKDAHGLNERAKDLVRELVLQLAHEGAREVKKSGPNTGQALDWSRLNFAAREKEMVGVLVDSLRKKDNAEPDNKWVVLPVSDERVLFHPWAIPAAFSIPAAREIVGQPFLRDHEISGSLNDDIGGPVHIIACQKNVTEAQAMRLLGFPDATIVSGSFGVYVADNIQKIQLCLISNCRDPGSTKHGLQKFFDWLQRTGEDKPLAKRALSRAKILKAIAGELE